MMRPNVGPTEAVTAGVPMPPLPAPGARLDGLRIAVKDLVAVAGEPLQAGTLARSDAPPEPRDAAVVAQLRAAGAMITGTVALHEIAFGTTGVNDQVGFPPNPHDPLRVPGGSSSGSAVAVAEGQADLAIGTDTGGSVRIPAALCGVVGFKPSYDRYPRDGVLALSPTLDHVGLLASSVDRIIDGHRALTGETVPESTATGRLGVHQESLAVADDVVTAAVRRALAALEAAGWELVDVSLPDRARVQEVTTAVMFFEAAAVHAALWSQHPDRIGPDVFARLRRGADIPESDYLAALDDAARLRVEVASLLDGVEAVVEPTVPIVAPTIVNARSDDTLPAVLVSNTRLGNVTRVPTLTLPITSDGLPVGLQLMATTDAGVLGVGRTLSWQAGTA